MRVLIAEDNQFYRHMLGQALKQWGYEVVAVDNGEAAWRVLQEADAPLLAVLDWMMPGMDGVEVCRRLREISKPEPTYIILLTAKGGKENVVAALEGGADDFITKPFDHAELHARLKVGIRIVRLQTSQTVVFAFARAVEAKSPYTHGHAERVTEYAVALARRVGLSSAALEVLRRGALLHDIGKISVPDEILNKPGPLTDEETLIVQEHPAQGASIVARLQSLDDVIPLIRWHHERIDGRGYPDGLAGDAIPPMVRILSVADVYDALASARPYRAAIPHARCLDILRQNAQGGGLEPALVEEFCDPSFVIPSVPVSPPEPRSTTPIRCNSAGECEVLA